MYFLIAKVKYSIGVNPGGINWNGTVYTMASNETLTCPIIPTSATQLQSATQLNTGTAATQLLTSTDIANTNTVGSSDVKSLSFVLLSAILIMFL
jgi:hypothetical protein